MYKLFLFFLLLQPCLGYNYFYNTNMTMSIDSPSRVNLTERRRIKIDVPNNEEDENEK